MGPKKAAPKKKKEPGPETGGELDIESKAKLYLLNCNSLQLQLGTTMLRLKLFFVKFELQRKELRKHRRQ
jgi:hypothetical protein